MDQRVTRSRVAAARVSLLAGDGHAATVQFGSIEAALAAAADGDRVVLSPGIYRHAHSGGAHAALCTARTDAVTHDAGVRTGAYALKNVGRAP